MSQASQPPGNPGPITIHDHAAYGTTVLTAQARAFLQRLAQSFEPRRRALLAERQVRQARFDQGELPDFLPETREIRESDWRIADLPDALLDRRVEITGPVDRKMIINALNSGARVFMADFEDSSSPTWDNMVAGQKHLMDAVRGSIEFEAPGGKTYRLEPEPALLMARPRGLHLEESHACWNGAPIGASLFDAGLYLFHNTRRLIDAGLGPWLYLPKLEHYQEAAWWNDVLGDIEAQLGLEPGVIKTTVLIETLPAVFQMDEILHALRGRAAALNCGRWDYIFSYIKVLRNHSDRLLPDRSQVTMGVEFLDAYSRLLIRTCHRRGALAMGGMAAQIPVRNDEAANRNALAAVRRDKEREAGNGHDGTWVAHPGLIPLAMEVFDGAMAGPNQLDRFPDGDDIDRDRLLAVPQGTRTESGGRACADVALRYLAAWLRGQGCVPIHHLMEDAATAEIARCQLWQWIHHDARLDDGSPVDADRVAMWIADAMQQISAELGEGALQSGRYTEAGPLLERLVRAPDLAHFLTLEACTLLEET